MYNTKDIITALPITDYVRRNKDIPSSFGVSGTRGVSPFTGRGTVQVWAKYWVDFSTGEHGDVIDFAAFHQFDGDRGQAIDQLGRLTGAIDDGTPQSMSWKNYTDNLNAMAAYNADNLSRDHQKMLDRYGITDLTIERLHIGTMQDGEQAGRLYVPTVKNGYVASYATLGTKDGEQRWMRMPSDAYNENCLWGVESITRDPYRHTAIVCEDVMDALPFEQVSFGGEGWAVLSGVTGAFTGAQMDELLPLLRVYQSVVLVNPSDRLMRRLLNENITFEVIKTPTRYSSIIEYYGKTDDLPRLLEEAEMGVIAMAKLLAPNHEKDLTALCRKACRFLTKSAVSQVFSKLSQMERWDKDFLGALRQECAGAPSEDFIASEVLRRHQILSNELIGAYEYDGRCWQILSDGQLGKYVDAELGPFATGSKVSSIKRLVLARATTNRRPNDSNVWCFLNGTLELEPKLRFRSHSPDDFCTCCLPYPFIEGAHCDDWERFIADVMNSDTQKMALLQEAAGYVLYADNSLQAAVFLKGEGSNGKSIYQQIIRQTLGEERCTDIPVALLDEPFQLVELSTSILNTCDEINGSLKKAEEAFKSVVGNGSVSACYKGKGTFSFRSRAKFLINVNNFPQIDDTSRAFFRRCVFVDFPNNYIINGATPRRKNDRIGDVNLSKKFESPEAQAGIFQWVLQGYQRLRKNNGFTVTAEGTLTLERFREVSDPVFSFLRDAGTQTLGDRIEGSTLYIHYCNWCEQNGHAKASSTRFYERAGKAIDELYPEYEEYRSGTCRHNWRIAK